jgi:endoglucanase
LFPNDPANHYVYEAHQYFDGDNGGSYSQTYDQSGAYPNIGVDRVTPFINWLKQNHQKGFLGEYGVPNDDPRWLTVMSNVLNLLQQNCMGSTYWAGGQWWGNYSLSIEPNNGTDAAQMGVLQNFVGLGGCTALGPN